VNVPRYYVVVRSGYWFEFYSPNGWTTQQDKAQVFTPATAKDAYAVMESEGGCMVEESALPLFCRSAGNC